MYRPPLELLRAVVRPTIQEARAEPIKKSATPADVYRIWLVERHTAAESTIILKRIQPEWPDDPAGCLREVRFYRDLGPCLRLPQPQIYYAGLEPDSQHRVVVMSDLLPSHRFPPPTHTWRQAEIRSILRTYAVLHARGQRCLPPHDERDWLVTRHERRITALAGRLTEMVKELCAIGIWQPISAFPALLDRLLDDIERFGDVPPTVLHNDVYPPNAGLPRQAGGSAALLDWEMAGWGLAELDLAFMFLQPYGSHRMLNREEALDYYWACREELEEPADASRNRKSRQRYADAIWALWLIPVAYEMARRPYPAGSSVRHYWDAMFPVLGERLRTLSHGTH